ncbi:hypothetical protein EON67_05400 [archaeon]|nr:MAG: hypothetical protein EON67_05400 [archaeon]
MRAGAASLLSMLAAPRQGTQCALRALPYCVAAPAGCSWVLLATWLLLSCRAGVRFTAEAWPVCVVTTAAAYPTHARTCLLTCHVCTAGAPWCVARARSTPSRQLRVHFFSKPAPPPPTCSTRRRAAVAEQNGRALVKPHSHQLHGRGRR